MIKTFNDILQEAIYSPRKMFYHVSYNNFSKFENRNNYRKDNDAESGVFLSPSMLMIKYYLIEYLSPKFNKDEYYLYRCFLTKDLNIFNPSNLDDKNKFIKILRRDPRGFYEKFVAKAKSSAFIRPTLDDLINHLFEYNNWEAAENPAVTSIIRELGYDGYESTENDVTNILVYDANNIKVPDNGPWKTIPAQNSVILRKFFDENFGEEINARRNIANNKKSRGNTNKKDYDYLSSFKKDQIFAVTLMYQGDEISYNDLSLCFDKTGKLAIDRVYEFFHKWFENIGDKYVQYDYKQFKKYEDLERYFKKKFDWVQFEDEDYVDEFGEAADGLLDGPGWDEEDEDIWEDDL